MDTNKMSAILVAIFVHILSMMGHSRAVHHCLTALKLCQVDKDCTVLLTTIRQHCRDTADQRCQSPEAMACSSALDLIQSRDFLQDPCVCPDSVDNEECIAFLRSIFHHSCQRPAMKGTCQLCGKDKHCCRLLQHFRKTCRVRKGECRMHSRTKCNKAYMMVKEIEVTSCKGKDLTSSENCKRLLALLVQNPCVDMLHKGLPAVTGDENKSPESDIFEDILNFLRPKSILRPSMSIKNTTTSVPEVHSLVEMPPTSRPSSNTNPVDQAGRRNIRLTHYPEGPSSQSSAESTCGWAYESCQKDESCNILLGNLRDACGTVPMRCNRTECMQAIRNFYEIGNPTKTYEVAFCTCSQNDLVCLEYLRKLHPACAQSSLGHLTGCDQVAEVCFSKDDCRPRLERFMEACAVDSRTLGCSGSTRFCQAAVVGVLGILLPSKCGCYGNNINVLYKCIDWQRTVWLNPCVVEAQRDFLRNKSVLSQPSPRVDVSHDSTTTLPLTTVLSPTTSPKPTTWLSAAMPSTLTPSLLATATTRILLPSGVEQCVLPGTFGKNITIAVGSGKRLYSKGEMDCSSVCVCHVGVQLLCSLLPCTERLPCLTSFTVYSHTAPAYKAYRGRCMCFSGNFICMKPSPQLYELKQGIFLFLGYSEVEERLLRPYTQLSIVDSVRRLSQMMEERRHEDGGCKLVLAKHIGENIIVQAQLDDYESDKDNSSAMERLNKEEELCYPILKNFTDMINNNVPFIRRDVLLSLFKLAEVEIYRLKSNSAAGSRCRYFQLETLFQLLPVIFIFYSSCCLFPR